MFVYLSVLYYINIYNIYTIQNLKEHMLKMFYLLICKCFYFCHRKAAMTDDKSKYVLYMITLRPSFVQTQRCAPTVDRRLNARSRT